MTVRLLITFYLLIFFNNVNCLTWSNPHLKNITLDEYRRLLHENGSGIESHVKPKSKCESYGCVNVAAYYINENLDPCDNFYQFASGHFINETTIETEDYEPRGFYSSVTDLMKKEVGPLLSEPVQPNEWKPFQLAKNFFESCVNEKIIVQRRHQELIDIVDALEGLPAAKGSKWLSRKFDLVRLMGKVKELGFDTGTIFDVKITTDLNNNSVLYISSGSYEMDEVNKKGLAKYLQKMFQKSTIFMDKSDAKAKVRLRKEMKKVYAFMEMLSKISSSDAANHGEEEGEEDDGERDGDSDEDDAERSGDYDEDDGERSSDSDENDEKEVPLYTVYSIKQLQESYPYLNWLDYINVILPVGLNVTENEPIVNKNPQFFEKLASVMNTTSRRTIANYIVWRAINSADKLQTFETGKVRRSECIDMTSKLFSIPVGLLYSRKYFNENSRQEVINLVEDVRHAFIDILAGVTWMDEVTRQKAISKAESIVADVGYPSDLYENNSLDEYYADLEMEPNTYVKNCLRGNLFNSNHKFNSLRRPVDRSTWEEMLALDPTVANAFYYNNRNAMQFPLAILHEMFFSVNRPQYINYASLGSAVGHEITHGFDCDGSKYDLNGNLNNWWDAEAKRKFIKEAACFIDQYNHYTDATTNLTVDGKNTLNENMADNGGTRAAYYAYLNWIKRNGDEELVPGLNYNQKQLFWIAFAQAETSVYGESMLTFLIKNDEHAPSEFRVNGVVSNLKEFADDFNCPVGTKMNPLKKCKVW